jgi:hypothetical protein
MNRTVGRSHRFLILVALVVAICTVPAAAQAALRFARPGGAGFGDCTGTSQINPKCRIDHAVKIARAGDHVVLDAGTYTLTSTLTISNPITLEPGAAGVRPLITLTGAQADTLRVAASGSGTTIPTRTGRPAR